MRKGVAAMRKGVAVMRKRAATILEGVSRLS